MSRLEVLCVSMGQKDFSLAEKLRIHCDAVIANQTDEMSLKEKTFEWGNVKLASTPTRGVGKNRNIAFMYATGDILLLSDDDMEYYDTYVDDILKEFDSHPDADVIIFNIITNGGKRQQKQNKKTRRTSIISRMPYGAPRIAIRREAWEKSNVWFTTLFGGGARFSNGEDSIFIHQLRKYGANIYVSKYTIGTIRMDESSWFHGYDRTFYYNKGAYCEAVHPYTKCVWWIYHSIRTKSPISIYDRIRYMVNGARDYRNKS